MTASAYEQSFAIVVGLEGGYSTEPADPGNWTGGAVGRGALLGTKYGISAASYPMLDIAGLTLDAAQAIYQRDYWNRAACGTLPPGLALLVFDAAVNNGVGRATRWLQVSVGTPADGTIGPATDAALKNALAMQGTNAVGAEFLAQRMNFMANLATWRSFGLGWARRLCSLPFHSLSMKES
jgi:lysozyme family protein